MPVLGVYFNTINAQRLREQELGKIEVSTDLKLTNVEKKRINKTDVVQVDFDFKTDYNPGLGFINITGFVYYSQEKIGKILEKDKNGKLSVNRENMIPIHNSILSNCFIKALELARDLRLPLPVKLPRVEIEKEKSKPTAS